MTIDQIMRSAPVIPVLVLEGDADWAELARILVEAGLPVLEVTLRTPAGLDAIRTMQAASPEYPQIWHMFAFLPRATEHLARFTQEIMRESAPLSPGIRELIAAYTSSENQCPF